MSDRICRWTLDEDHGAWDTECDNKHQFIDGSPKENHHAWCPYCGGKLRVLAKEQRRYERWDRLESCL